MAITKLDAARRQLNCAIRQYISNEDIVPVHTLSRAAFRILYDIYPIKQSDGFEKSVEALIQRLGWKQFNRVANFFKHADSDADDVVSEHTRADTEMGMGFACILYSRIAGNMTPEMKAFDMWMHAMHPNELPLPRDPDPEIEAEYRAAVGYVSTQPIKVQLILANALLSFYCSHPDKL
jgi:hypothetical protein